MTQLYVDGSFDGEKASWAYLIVDIQKKIIDKGSGIIKDLEKNKMYQIGGEIEAVIRGIVACKTHNIELIDICYDYSGLYNWVKDFFNKGKPWKRNNKFTSEYREFIQNNQKLIHSFKKIKSHSGDMFNDAVDQLSRQTHNI